MTCQNEKCEHIPTLRREIVNRSPEEVLYGQLWAEIELPKLLTERGRSN
ncbi:MAG: hypothetical protein ABR962_10635 [Candidatus Bathyarchaeia archaeon]